MLLITVDSNLRFFARKVAELVTNVALEDVLDETLVEQHVNRETGPTYVPGADQTTRTCSRRPVVDSTSRHGAQFLAKTGASRLKLYTVRSRWCGPDLIPNACIPVPVLCSKIRAEYGNYDLILFDTPKNEKSYTELERCLGRVKYSFVYVNGDADGSYVGQWQELSGRQTVVVLDNFKLSVRLAAEYVIILRPHNCSANTVAKFVAYLVKMYQRYGKIADVRIPRRILESRNFIEAPRRTVMYCNIYDFVETAHCVHVTIKNYDDIHVFDKNNTSSSSSSSSTRSTGNHYDSKCCSRDGLKEGTQAGKLAALDENCVSCSIKPL